MQINVSQQLKGTIGTERNYEVNEIIDVEGCSYTVQGTVKLMRTDHGILVKSNLNTQSELTCSRCVTEFDCPLAINIEEEYLPTTDIVSGSPLPVPDDLGVFRIDERNILDLTEAIRQYTLLVVPMKPLCKENCAGLCPTCGTNLNKSHCNCPPPPGDERWAVLRKLIQEDSQSLKNLKGRK